MAPDKRLHAQYGAAIGAGSVLMLNMMDYDGDKPMTATALCTGVGFGKELYDEYDYGGFDSKDLAVTAAFCALSAYGFDWALNVTPVEGGAMINYKYKWSGK